MRCAACLTSTVTAVAAEDYERGVANKELYTCAHFRVQKCVRSNAAHVLDVLPRLYLESH